MTLVRADQSPGDLLVAGVIGALFLVEIWGQAEFAGDRAAAELIVSEHTIKTHVARILHKLGLRNRVHAVVFCLRVRPRPARGGAVRRLTPPRVRRRDRAPWRDAGKPLTARGTQWTTIRRRLARGAHCCFARETERRVRA